ncbi:MAG: hypothetical protein ABMB14_26630, partial [Myxococcota bacterium]
GGLPVGGAHDTAAIVAALAAEVGSEPTIDAVAAALNARGDVTVVLDEVEERSGRLGAVLDQLLARAPRAGWLIVSQIPLDHPSERRMVLDTLSNEDGAALFRSRAEALGAVLGPGDDDAVSELVARLDGLPLAIELAASWGVVLAPRELVARLRDPATLRATNRALEPRHRTMDAAIGWAWNLLEPEDRAALARLSVFSGGWYLDGAEAVLGPPLDGPVDGAIDRAIDASGRLQLLVSRSMVRATRADADPVRFDVLEVIRRFASARLDPADRVDACDRHAEYTLGWVEQTALDGAAGGRRLAIDRANGTLAAQHRAATDPARIARIGASVLRAQLRTLAAIDPPLVELTVEAAERSGDPGLEAYARVLRIGVLARRGRPPDRSELDAVRRLAPSAEPNIRAIVLNALAVHTDRDEDRPALWEEAVRATSEGDRPYDAAYLHHNLALYATGKGDLPAALAAARQAVDLARASGALDQRPSSILLYAVLRHRTGDLDGAAATCAEAASLGLSGWYLGLRYALDGVRALDAGAPGDAIEPLSRAGPLVAAVSPEPIPGLALAVAACRAVAAARVQHPHADDWLAEARSPSLASGVLGPSPSPDPLRRAMDRALGMAAEAAGPSPPGLELFGEVLERLASARRSVAIGPDCGWVAVDGAAIALTARPVARRLVQCLVEVRRTAPGAPASAGQLIEAGWPGEKILADAAANRLYAVLSALRKLGLGAVLQRVEGGWRLDPDVPVIPATGRGPPGTLPGTPALT